jgi:hypothetical protein
MGMYDSVIINCPKCNTELEFQSKSGECLLQYYTLENCPEDVFANINRHSPHKCKCGSLVSVNEQTKEIIVL